MNVNKFAEHIGKVGIVFFFIAILIAASPLKRSEQTHCIYVFNSSNSTPEQMNVPTNIASECKNYNSICWRNMGTDTTKFVYISSFSNTTTITFGWPVAGTKEECRNWTQNVPLWLVGSAPDASVEFRLSLSQ